MSEPINKPLDPSQVQLWNNEADCVYHAHGNIEEHFVEGSAYKLLWYNYQALLQATSPKTIFLVGQYDDIDGVFLTREKAVEFAEKKYAHMPHHPPESFISEHKVDQG